MPSPTEPHTFPNPSPCPSPLQGTAHSLSSQPEFLPFPAQIPSEPPRSLLSAGVAGLGGPKAAGASHVRARRPRSLRSLFVEQSRLSAEARQSLLSACPGPLCVELHEYGQVSAHLRRYAQGSVTVWLGTEYTTYGLYGIVPQVGTEPARGAPGSCGLGDGPMSPPLGAEVTAPPPACPRRRSCWRRNTRLS